MKSDEITVLGQSITYRTLAVTRADWAAARDRTRRRPTSGDEWAERTVGARSVAIED